MRLLIIEDESQLRKQLKAQLEDAGFAVDSAIDGEEGYFMGNEYPFDLAIVDLGLPKMPGIDLIKKWRDNGKNFPIIILTAQGRWQDKVEGLSTGADDYLTKPFHQEELIARINALVRRSAGLSQPIIKSGVIALNTIRQEVTVKQKKIELTAYEYKVLEYLMLHQGEVISKTELTDHLYDQDFDRDSNVIEVFVGRLRKKIDPHQQYNPINTLRGRGYCFNKINA